MTAAGVGVSGRRAMGLIASRGVNRREVLCPGAKDRKKKTSSQLSLDALKVFTWLETDSSSGWNANLFACPWISADASLARLDLKNAEPSQLDSFTPFHGSPHGIEDGIDGHLGFHLGDVSKFRDFVDYVHLDHKIWLKRM